jgi:hypothetical protein
VDVEVDRDVDDDLDGDLDLNGVATVDEACVRFFATRRPSMPIQRHAELQRLDVYQRAIEFLSFAIEIVEDLPRGHAERGDQLIRAARWVAAR